MTAKASLGPCECLQTEVGHGHALIALQLWKLQLSERTASFLNPPAPGFTAGCGPAKRTWLPCHLLSPNRGLTSSRGCPRGDSVLQSSSFTVTLTDNIPRGPRPHIPVISPKVTVAVTQCCEGSTEVKERV